VVAAVALVPAAAIAEAPPLIGAIKAVDFDWTNPAGGGNEVVIAPGGTVEFSYPSGGNAHNVVFEGAAPTSCTQTAGPGSGGVPPLPGVPTAAGWAGDCKFDVEGTFEFVCGLHSFMHGSVVVSATVPPPKPPGGGGGGGGAGGGGGSGGGGAAGTGPAASKLVLSGVQRGGVVRGSVLVGDAGSRLLVELSARRAALGGKGAGLVGVGRLAKAVGAGKRTFAVNLSGAAKRAIAADGRLAVTVKVKVTPAAGAAFKATRPVTVKPRG
jgi:plastocyanin